VIGDGKRKEKNKRNREREKKNYKHTDHTHRESTGCNVESVLCILLSFVPKAQHRSLVLNIKSDCSIS